ncbi:MAG: hypothetical protein GX604_06495 [Actinobacteria bacterium]|nr:hypothetical protein [Actinomycetota bacterium]
MGLWDKLRKALGGSAPAKTQGDPNAVWLYLRCGRCGTAYRVRVDRRNDLSREDGPGEFLVRKQAMDNKCFQLMEVEAWFDANYQIVSSEVSVGELITEEEYKAAQPS